MPTYIASTEARRKGALVVGLKSAARNRPNATRWMRRCARSTQVAWIELHTATDPGRAGKSCRAAGIEPRTRNALLTRSNRFRGAGLPSTGSTGATVVRGQLPHQQPRPTPARALCEAESRADPRSTAATGEVGEGHVLCSEPMYRSWPPISRSECRASPVQQARLVATAPNQTGTSPSCWGRPSYFYLTSCSTSSAATRSAGWSRENSALAGRLIEEAQVLTLQLRPRRADDEQVHRTNCSPTS